MTTNSLMTRHLNIYGLVQAVGFRNYLEYKARELGICGWIRNRPDHSVETCIQGHPHAIHEFIACAQRGPRKSRVTLVTVNLGAGTFSAYERHPTA
jgi:acylphosphatase